MPANNVFICTPERAAAQLSITIPGIGQLRSIKQTMDGVPTPEALAMVMLGQISPALAPMTAILRIADAVFGILAVFKAIVADPFSISGAVSQLEKKFGFLLEFVPGVAYVKLVRDMLTMVEQILRGMSSLIIRWVTELQAISKTLESASLLGDTGLSASGYCSGNRLIEVQQATQISLQDVGQILKIIKLIADIVRAVVQFELPGISEVADIVDTLSTSIAATPGNIGEAAEQERILTISHDLSVLADRIHGLVVKVTEVVGS